MKTLKLYMCIIMSALLAFSCSNEKSDDKEIPDNKILIVNGTAYELSQAFLTYEGDDPLNEGYQYELIIASSGMDMEQDKGVGDGLSITIIVPSKGMIERAYTFDTDPARALETFSAYVVIRFNLETWERKHFLVITSGTLDIIQNGANNYTITLSAKANDIDDDDNIITSNNTVEMKYTGYFIYSEY